MSRSGTRDVFAGNHHRGREPTAAAALTRVGAAAVGAGGWNSNAIYAVGAGRREQGRWLLTRVNRFGNGSAGGIVELHRGRLGLEVGNKRVVPDLDHTCCP